MVLCTQQNKRHSDDEDDCGNLFLLLFNFGNLLFIYLSAERRGEGLRGQVEDPPAAHHLQPHQQLLSPLSVREVHDHVSTRAGHPEPEG